LLRSVASASAWPLCWPACCQALPATVPRGRLPWADLHVLSLLSALARLLAALRASRIDEPDA